MTRIVFSRNKLETTRSATHRHYRPSSDQHRQQHKRRRHARQPSHLMRWANPSIVLLLASCLVFVVLLTFDSGDCTRLVGVHKLAADENNNNRPTTTIFSGNSRVKRAHSGNNNAHNINNNIIRLNQHHRSIIHNNEANAAAAAAVLATDGDEINHLFGPLQKPQQQRQHPLLDDAMEISNSISSGSNSELLSDSFETSNNQQVPEQALPIVVSSSDNSYVSASPIIETTTHNNNHHIASPPSHRHHHKTTTTTPTNGTQSKHHFLSAASGELRSITSAVSQRVHYNGRARLKFAHLHTQRQHPRREQPPQQLAMNSAFENNNRNGQVESLGGGREHWNSGRRRLATMQMYRARQQQQLGNEEEEEDVYSIHGGNPAPPEAAKQQQQQQTSSDISTTATTTQRNRSSRPAAHSQRQQLQHRSHHHISDDIVQNKAGDSESSSSSSQAAEAAAQRRRKQKRRANVIVDNDDDEEDDDDLEEAAAEAEETDENSDDDYATAANRIGNSGVDQISSFASFANERTRTMTPSSGDKSRPSVGAHYSIKRATIIKTRESIESGATFINYTLVTNLNACLVECWITDNCDTAIYQESPVDFSNHLPYLINNNNNNNYSKQDQRINHNIVPQQQQQHNRARAASASVSSLSNLLAMGGDNPIGGSEDDSSNSTRIRPNDSTYDDNDDDDDDDANADEKDDDADAGNESSDEQEDDDDDDDVDNSISGYPADRQQRKPGRGFFICYLFQCAKDNKFKCQFSAHNYYVSSVSRRAMQAAYARAENAEAASQRQRWAVDFDDTRPAVLDAAEPHYANIISGRHQNHWHAGRSSWHDSHVASIRIGQEDYDRNEAPGDFNSAIIALAIGVCATGMLIMIVGHKMRTIRKKIAYKAGRRRSLVPDADFLMNSMPIES